MEAGFETADLHAFMIDQALRNSDRQQLLTALAAFDRYCRAFGQPNEESLVQTFQSRWDSCYNQLNPQPSVGEVMSEQARGFAGGRGGRPGGPPSSGRPGGPGRSHPFNSDEEQQLAGNNASSPNRPGPGGSRGGIAFRGGPDNTGGPGFRRPPANSVALKDKVTINILAGQAFDINKMFQDLWRQLGVAGGSCSRSNNRGQIVLHYSGQLEAVAKAIDFGNIKGTDQANRTIEVSIDR